MSDTLIIYTDASYRKSGVGSYTYCFILNDKIYSLTTKSTVGIKINCLELLAIKKALEHTNTIFFDLLNKKIKHIEFYTDSQNSINYINSIWKVENENLKIILDDFKIIEKTFKTNYPKIKLSFNHVKAHANNKLNIIVDKISQIISEYNNIKR